MVIPSRQRLSNNACKKKKYKLYFAVFHFFQLARDLKPKLLKRRKRLSPFPCFFLFGGFDPRELLIFMIKVSSDICSALIPFTA